MRRRLLPTLAATATSLAAAAALLAPASASAALWGIESNAELINSDRTTAHRVQTLNGMRQLGAQVVRVNMRWYALAPNCGDQTPQQLRSHANPCYDWTAFDEVVQLAAARRMQVLVSVSQAPQWLHGSANRSFLGNSDAQWARTLAHYEAMMFAAASRYRAGSAHGHVRMWTVWNEPNSPVYLAPQASEFQRARTARRYAQLLARSAVQVKQANPRALVAGGPTGPTGGCCGTKPITFLTRVQAALPGFLPGGTMAAKRRWVDAWAHNPYPGATVAPSRGTIKSPAVGMTNIADLFRRLDRTAILKGKPVWATEFGYQTNPPDRTAGIPPALQARYMAESFDWLDRSRRVTVAIWYGYRDGDALADWQSGVLYHSGARKPSFGWYQRAISVPVDRVRRGSLVRVWARSAVRPGATRIAWSTDGRTWKLLPLRGRRADGSMVQTVRVTRTIRFATWDGMRGPLRLVRVG